MATADIPYDMPATLAVWHYPSDPAVDPADVVLACQQRAYDNPVNFGQGTYNNAPRNYIELLVPYGSAIFSADMVSWSVADLVAFTEPAVYTYEVLWVEVIYRGFPKQCYRVVARRLAPYVQDDPLP